MLEVNENLFAALGGGEQTRRAALEAKRLEQMARKFGFRPQKREYGLSPPLGTQKERLRFSSQR